MKREIKKTLEQELLIVLTDRKASVFARLDAGRILCGLFGIVLTETVIDNDKALANSKLGIHWKAAKKDILSKTLKRQEQRRLQNKRYRLRKKIAQQPNAEELKQQLHELETLERAKPQANEEPEPNGSVDTTVQEMLAYLSRPLAGQVEPTGADKTKLGPDYLTRPVTITEREQFRQLLLNTKNSYRDDFGAFSDVPNDAFPRRESDLGEWVKRKRQEELQSQGEQ